MTGPEIEDALFKEAMAADAYRVGPIASQQGVVGCSPQGRRPYHPGSELGNLGDGAQPSFRGGRSIG